MYYIVNGEIIMWSLDFVLIFNGNDQEWDICKFISIQITMKTENWIYFNGNKSNEFYWTQFTKCVHVMIRWTMFQLDFMYPG